MVNGMRNAKVVGRQWLERIWIGGLNLQESRLVALIFELMWHLKVVVFSGV